MKHVLLASVLVLSLNVAHAKKGAHKSHKAAKMSKIEAKELCLTTKGAELSKKELKKCISKAMRSGKV